MAGVLTKGINEYFETIFETVRSPLPKGPHMLTRCRHRRRRRGQPARRGAAAQGVDEMSWDDLSKNEMEWPAVAEVTEYRRQARLPTHPPRTACVGPA